MLCEKAMLQNSKEAALVFKTAKEKQIFVMEAMWSRFLPAVKKVKSWIEEGSIGIPEIAQFSIGLVAPEGKENRYFNPKLGGGAAKDITVYAYELTTYILNQRIKNITASATWSDTGVDINDHISIDFEYTLADLTASFVTKMEDKMVIYGRKGKIESSIVPWKDTASCAELFDKIEETRVVSC